MMAKVYIPKGNGRPGRLAQPRPSIALHPCEHCGGVISSPGSMSAVKNKRYCGKVCAARANAAKQMKQDWVCGRCKQRKPRGEFLASRTRLSGGSCLACRAEAAIRRDIGPRRYRQLLYQAKARGIRVTLTRAEWAAFEGLPCHWCKTPADEHVRLDRIDNHGIYERANLLPACFTCNRARGQLTTQEWVNHVAAIALVHPAKPIPYDPKGRPPLNKRTRFGVQPKK